MTVKEIIQGESLLFSLTPNMGGVDDWTASFVLRETLAGSDIVARSITDTSDTALLGWLTGDETAALGVGSYVICAKLNNATTTPEYDVESRIKVVVHEGCT